MAADGKNSFLTEVIHNPSELTHKLSHQKIHKLGKIYIVITISTGIQLWNVFLDIPAEPEGGICPLSFITAETSLVLPYWYHVAILLRH